MTDLSKIYQPMTELSNKIIKHPKWLPQHVILLGQLDHSPLQYQIVEASLLAATLRRLVVAAAPIPVRVVLLGVRNELALLA